MCELQYLSIFLYLSSGHLALVQLCTCGARPTSHRHGACQAYLECLKGH